MIEFNNNFSSFSHWGSFLMNICHFAIFTQKLSQEGENRCFIYLWADYYLQANTIRWHVQTIICRQLFAVHVVDSPPMKRKKNLHLDDNYVIYLFSDQSFYKGSRIQPAQLSMFHLLWQWSLMLTFLYIARVKQLGIWCAKCSPKKR